MLTASTAVPESLVESRAAASSPGIVRAAVSYGSEAGLFQAAGYDGIICGPGDIDRAHKPAEWIAVSELQECRRFLERLATSEPLAG